MTAVISTSPVIAVALEEVRLRDLGASWFSRATRGYGEIAEKKFAHPANRMPWLFVPVLGDDIAFHLLCERAGSLLLCVPERGGEFTDGSGPGRTLRA